MTKKISDAEIFAATKEGIKEVIKEALDGATDVPGRDILEEIRAGVKEAALEWFEKNKSEVLLSMQNPHRDHK